MARIKAKHFRGTYPGSWADNDEDDVASGPQRGNRNSVPAPREATVERTAPNLVLGNSPIGPERSDNSRTSYEFPVEDQETVRQELDSTEASNWAPSQHLCDKQATQNTSPAGTTENENTEGIGTLPDSTMGRKGETKSPSDQRLGWDMHPFTKSKKAPNLDRNFQDDSDTLREAIPEESKDGLGNDPVQTTTSINNRLRRREQKKEAKDSRNKDKGKGGVARRGKKGAVLLPEKPPIDSPELRAAEAVISQLREEIRQLKSRPNAAETEDNTPDRLGTVLETQSDIATEDDGQREEEVLRLKERLDMKNEELEKTKDTVAKLEKDNNGLRSELCDLKKQETDANSRQHEHLRTALATTKREEERLREDLRERDAGIESLNAKLSRDRRSAELVEIKNQELKERVSECEAEVGPLLKRVSDLDGKLRDAKKESRGREEELAQLKSAAEVVSAELEQKLADAKREAHTQRERADDLAIRLESAEYSDQENCHRADMESQKAKAQEVEVQKLTSQFTNLRSEAERSTSKLQGALRDLELKATEAENYRQKASELTSRVESLEKEAQNSVRKHTELGQHYREVRQQLQESRQHKSSLDVESKQLRFKLDESRRSIEVLTKENTELQMELTQVQEEKSKSTRRAGRAEQQFQESEQRRSSLEAETKQLQLQLDGSRRDMDELAKQKAQLQTKLVETQAQATTSAELAELHLEESRQQGAKFQAQCETLREQLLDDQHRMSTNTAEMDRLTRQLSGSRQEVSALKQASDRLQASSETTRRVLTTQLQEAITNAKKHKEDAARAEAKADAFKLEAEADRKRSQGSAEQVKQLEEVLHCVQSRLQREKGENLQNQVSAEGYKAKTDKLSSEVVDLHNDLERTKAGLESLRESYNVLRAGGDVTRKLESQLQDSQNEVAELKKRLEKQEKFIAHAQDAARQKMKDDRKEKSQSVDDEELEGRLQVDIEARARQWAYAYGVRKVKGDLPETAYQALKEEFGNVTGGGDMASLCKRYDADIVLHGLLVCFVTEHILSKPFLLFELEAGQAFAERMAKWYEGRLEIDKPSAYKWRYQELQWLGGSMLPTQSKSWPGDVPALLAEDGDFFDDLAKRFINSPAKFLLKYEAAQAPSSLRPLKTFFTKAAQVGLMMWTQPFEVEIRGFNHLRGLRFTTDSADAEAKTHSSQLNPRRRPSSDAVVDFVVQPSIVARPEQGMEKVWGQAVVLWN
ncbi:hypothetical protein QBC33DRAFT_563080 [Phialemonium atrogriseum]|uniref:Uncharacterized protein n=1 Tax=Phialemonium atrogriseum TaxID=1093897 RepID=A0AAJ0BRE4_9PEZI|nr:uncharacterized protein QBC33DRAFT_563080 [Phialemonium atrogriseum]KAK1763088.1 hypothetical protein QBC33DRAFT_563080 [Phialemonium atrogriseum]